MPRTLFPLAAGATALSVVFFGARAGRGTPAPGTGDVRVTVTVLGSDGQRSPAAQAVVWIPDAAAKPGALSSPSGHARIASKGKRFDPRVTAVPVGTTVDFPNLDGIFHNVFSLSGNATFDLGLYRNGATRTMTFDHPGLVRIYCNIHPQMAAFLMVIDGTIWAQTAADGSATLANVPAGHVGVRAWAEKGGDYLGAVDVAAGKTAQVAITLDGSSWRETPHTNKYGKKYPPPDDDANRY